MVNSRYKSFTYAFHGLKTLLIERNIKIHFIITSVVIVFGFWYHISSIEWLAILLAIGLVFSLETMNTTIEYLSDHVSPEKNEQIKKVKDLAAAGVLIGAIAAACVGLIIFIPKVFP